METFYSFILSDDGNGEINEDGYVSCLYKRGNFINIYNVQSTAASKIVFFFNFKMVLLSKS